MAPPLRTPRGLGWARGAEGRPSGPAGVVDQGRVLGAHRRIGFRARSGADPASVRPGVVLVDAGPYGGPPPVPNREELRAIAASRQRHASCFCFASMTPPRPDTLACGDHASSARISRSGRAAGMEHRNEHGSPARAQHGSRVRKAGAVAAALLAAVACGRQQHARDESAAPSAPGDHRSAFSVAVSTSGGESAQYSYDPGGNLVAVRSGTTSLSISGVDPLEGCPGQLVTLYGTGFAPVGSQNTIRVGDASAPVQWATPTSIGFIVPRGAASGRVSVVRDGNSATSAETFTVVT